MKNTLKLALLASSALFATSTMAQNQPSAPEHYTLDNNNTDLVGGKFFYRTTDIEIGSPHHGGLSIGRLWIGEGWRDSFGGNISKNGNMYTVHLPDHSIAFTRNGDLFSPTTRKEFSLKFTTPHTLELSTGSTILFEFNVVDTYGEAESPYAAKSFALLHKKKDTSGFEEVYSWDSEAYCYNMVEDECIDYRNVYRIESIRTNTGYVAQFYYKNNSIGWQETSNVSYLSRKKVSLHSLSDTSCPDFQCENTTLTTTYTPEWTNGGSILKTENSDGRGESYSYGPWINSRRPLAEIRNSTASDNHISLAYTGDRVNTVTNAQGTWNYSYSDSGSTRTTTATGPLGQSLTVVSDQTIGRATSVTERVSASPAVSRTTSYTYDAQRRLKRVTQPDGDYAELTYDARGNVTQTLYAPKPGSGLGNITTSAVYPATCANPVTCNQPTSTTDALGNTTNYTYDATHGGLLTVTAPAPTSGAPRPETRITYAPQTAWYKNASGVLAAAPSAVTLPVSISECVTGSSCAGTANEVKTSIVYGAAGVANNLLPTSVTTGAGDGSLSATTAMTYTPVGDVATVDGPLPGTADTTTYRYDNARQLVGVIGPDPDGNGALLRRAERYTYNPRGQVTLAEAGTVTGTSDANWAAFTSLQKTATTYDNYGRPTHQRQQSGSTTHALAQTSYDAAGRAECVTTRMNPATFASPPASACTAATAGSFGPDRITKYGYDAASQLTSTVAGFGTSVAITERAGYSLNGKPISLTDGNGNISTLTYDGFDRIVKMNYPNATGGGTSTSDYEEYTYDAGGNVTKHRNRGGDTFNHTYDALGRQTVITGGGAANRTYAYDNLGRLTSASITGGGSMTRTWDALGRLTSETQNPLNKTVSYQYDLAGRRTRLTWPDGFFVNYDYNTAGDLTAIRENGATDWTLAAWNHDNLGRRTAMTRANGANSSWTYNAAGQLSQLKHDLPSTADDQTLTYTYNPAGQILTRAMSNPAYAYAPAAGTVSYVNNGRNQVTSAGGAPITYGLRQNMHQTPMGTYAFDTLNQLITATVGGTSTSFTYDAAGRMNQMGTTRLLHDGARPMAEYDAAGNIQRRYVPGLAMDETVTAYEGSGLTDRRWLLADERLSVTAYTNTTGGILARNTYDEYGQPGPGNAGLFQYTGQMWLPQAQAYNYKARIYAPQLGRFMQTDPIGYGDGPNLYAYVGGDPVNLSDPWGNQATEVRPIIVTGRRFRRDEFERNQNIVDGGVSDGAYDLGQIIVNAGRRTSKIIQQSYESFNNNYCLVSRVEGVVGGVAEGKIGAKGAISGNASIDIASIRLRAEQRGFRPSLGAYVTQGLDSSLEIGAPGLDGTGADLRLGGRRETNLARGLAQRMREQRFETKPSAFIGIQGGAAVVAGGNFRIGLETGPC